MTSVTHYNIPHMKKPWKEGPAKKELSIIFFYACWYCWDSVLCNKIVLHFEKLEWKAEKIEKNKTLNKWNCLSHKFEGSVWITSLNISVGIKAGESFLKLFVCCNSVIVCSENSARWRNVYFFARTRRHFSRGQLPLCCSTSLLRSLLIYLNWSR